MFVYEIMDEEQWTKEHITLMEKLHVSTSRNETKKCTITKIAVVQAMRRVKTLAHLYSRSIVHPYIRHHKCNLQCSLGPILPLMRIYSSDHDTMFQHSLLQRISNGAVFVQFPIKHFQMFPVL